MNADTELIPSEILLNVLEFVKQRQKSTGGFAATPKLPATVEDTYHSLRIISSISPKIQPQYTQEVASWTKLTTFLARFMEGDIELGPRGIYQLLWCMKFCKTLPESERVYTILKGNLPRNLHREHLFFALRIIKDVLEVDGRSRLMGTLVETRIQGLFSGILKRRFMDLIIDQGLEWHMISKEKAAGWFSACQNPDGGFGFMPGTTSYIENCHYGLSALTLLGSWPADGKACWNFIMGCRTKSGGFSRNSNAAPFLDATWHAVKSLLILTDEFRHPVT